MTDPTQADVRKYLSAHGHGFQYAVLGHAKDLAERSLSRWVFEAAEFPVGSLQNTIHIDFILRSRTYGVFLVAECKRADPALSSWCFVKAPYSHRGAYENELVFQKVDHQPGNIVSEPLIMSASLESCHLAFELRGQSRGEGTSGGGRSAINDAATQVLRGMNGLVDRLFPSTGDKKYPRPGRVIFLPVIFTTARLWVTDGDLSVADLATGRLPDEWGTLKSVPWLWFSHNQSPALRHRLPFPSAPSGFDLSTALRTESTRSIAVVGCEGIETFLQANLTTWLE